jgi:hypothetical protein
VSTILRALKKLEQENANQPAGSATGHAFNARQAVYRKVRFAWRRGQLIRWGMVLLALAVGAAVLVRFYSSHGTGSHEESGPFSLPLQSGQENPAAPRPLSEAVVTERLDETIAGLPEEEIRSGRVAEVDPVAPIPGRPLGPDSLNPAMIRATPGRSLQHPRTQDGPAANLPPAAQEKKASVPASLSAAPPEIPIDAERLTEGRLKIQAIAWAPEPGDRMAVINNRILREGESVAGFTIIRIAEDQIILSAEGRRWRAVFGRR